MAKTTNNVLVAIMNNSRDFRIAHEKLWYRIPVKSAPPIIKDGKARLIAFYHTNAFKREKHTIQWFGEIKNVEIVKRKELIKEEPDPKAENDYYKIEFSKLHQLPIPIISLRGRRLLFVPTTEEKFFAAKEINFLFNDSVLEDKFWNEMLKRNIYSERQYLFEAKPKNFVLDFAVFCKNKNIDVEVDGDKYHMEKDAVRSDKQRNNVLESKGWSVLRFTTEDIYKDVKGAVSLVMETINNYGGIQNPMDQKEFFYLGEKDGQIRMFN